MQLLKLFFIVSTSLLLFAYCSNKKHSAQKITRIVVNFHYPEKLTENHAEILDMDVFINYCGDYMLYELPYRVTNAIDNVLISDSMKYEFFIKHKDSSFGYNLKKLTDTLGKKISIDSSWSIRLIQNISMETVIKYLNARVVHQTKDETGEVDTYYFGSKEYDSGHFHYDKRLRDIAYTFSTSLDSSHDAKLYKVQLFAKKDTSTATRDLKDFNLTSWTISQVPVVHEKEIINFIENFKNK